jgi:hypothetical protein
MEIPDYPSNKGEQPQEKEIKRVISGDAVRRKKPLRKQFSETFVAGDMKSAMRYVMFDVLIPAAKDMISEAGAQGLDKLIYGETRGRRGGRVYGSTPPADGPQSGPTGFVSYSRYAMGSRQTGPQRTMSRRARSQHDFDEIILSSRVEAEEVIDKMFEIISRYGAVSISDLYELIGLPSTHTDNKWGWTDMRGAGVTKVREGFLLDLPEPKFFD